MKTKDSIAATNSIFEAREELDQARAIINALYIVTEGTSDTHFEQGEMNLALIVLRRIIDKADEELDECCKLL